MLPSLFWLLLAAVPFSLAMRQPPGYLRSSLGALHVICMVNNLIGDFDLVPSSLSELWASFTLASILHSFIVLFIQEEVVRGDSKSLIDHLRELFWAWSNFRRIPFTERTAMSAKKSRTKTRVVFATKRLFRVLILVLMNNSTTSLAVLCLRKLDITIEDFAPEKQSFLPPIVPRDLLLRMIISFYWILSNYFGITLAHDGLSVLFVTILQWDTPSEWPCVFGSVSEANSLRRFWGVFWHKLHVGIMTTLMPPCLCRKDGEVWWQRCGRSSLRALWIFLFSGICHGLVNRVLRKRTMRQDVQFFLSNYVICLAETVVNSLMRKRYSHDASPRIWERLLGYVWVLSCFGCTVPAWKYPLVYGSVAVPRMKG
ncbi:hypothetical protein F5B19DRAFT_480159 [Rostrohypoxylon terebratum]|nr:hypothetical protein F5B19DRAFT_480159 [Rostrohypoxylon terebratum]